MMHDGLKPIFDVARRVTVAVPMVHCIDPHRYRSRLLLATRLVCLEGRKRRRRMRRHPVPPPDVALKYKVDSEETVPSPTAESKGPIPLPERELEAAIVVQRNIRGHLSERQ